METISQIKQYVKCELAIKKINEYIEYMMNAPVTDQRSYSGLDEYQEYKYSYIHKMLDKYDFVNGDPIANSAQNNPNAALWRFIYSMASEDYVMEGDNHHASTLKRRDNFVKGLRILSLYMHGYSVKSYVENKKTITTSDGRKIRIGKATKIYYNFAHGINDCNVSIWNTKGRIASLTILDFI